MSNTCMNEMRISSFNKEKIRKFKESLLQWMDEGNKDLYTIAIKAGIAFERKLPNGREELFPYINTGRSYITDLDVTDDNFTVYTDSAWSPAIKVWKKLCLKFLGADFYLDFMSFEPECDLYVTNLKDYYDMVFLSLEDDTSELTAVEKERYQVFVGEKDGWTIDCDKDSLVKDLQKLLDSESESFDELWSLLLESSYEPLIRINEWQYEEVDEMD